MHFYLKVRGNHKQNYTKNLKLFLASMGETKLFHDSFLKFLLGLFEVVEVKGYLRLNFETSPQRGKEGGTVKRRKDPVFSKGDIPFENLEKICTVPKFHFKKDTSSSHIRP